MTVEQQLPETDPLMIAWKAYTQTPEFANTAKWAEQYTVWEDE